MMLNVLVATKPTYFLPAGIEKRANAKCINCGSLERHRILWHFLQHKTNLFSQY
jgi:hypothetical protein